MARRAGARSSRRAAAAARRIERRASLIATIACFLPSLLACAKDDGLANSADVNAQGTAERSAVANAGAARNRVPVGTRPPSACDWISASEAEALIGPFAAPPRQSEGGCLYTLLVSPELAARRARQRDIEKRLGSTLPMREGPYAVLLQVGLDVKTGERALRLAGEKMASWMKDDPTDTAKKAQPRPAEADAGDADSGGWDARRFNGGRLGTIDVSLIAQSYEVRVPKEKLEELTARVRDRIPDLPFAAQSDPYEEPSPDPCAVLTRAEAEAVLGRLIVAPYRSVDEGPLAAPNGRTCSYFTARHHALIVKPIWSDGKSELAMTRGIGGLMSVVVNDSEAQSADTIEGSWDETAISADGRLLLRKGDRAVEIEYETSSTDKAGALKLGKIMIGRLAAMR
jgi:hypothetical protein